MEVEAIRARSAGGQIRDAVTASLGCQPRRTPQGWAWGPKKPPGPRSAALRRDAAGRYELDVVLAALPETASISAARLWDQAAALVRETDRAAVPLTVTRDPGGGNRQIAARLTLRDTALDLPRQNRLGAAMAFLAGCAATIQAELPAATVDVVPEVPRELKGLVESLSPRIKQDSGCGDISRTIAAHLQAGMSVAIVGEPVRVRLELDRLARVAANIGILQQPTPIARLPQLARRARQGGLILASPTSMLRSRASVYEQGAEIDATLQELQAHGTAMLTYGTRQESESLFGVGQGRAYNPLMPVIEELPAVDRLDLARVAVSERSGALRPHEIDRLAASIVETADGHASSGEQLLQPLASLAAGHGPDQPDLRGSLDALAKDLSARRDTFGACEEAPATPRSADVDDHLRQRLRGPDLEDRLRRRIVGQDEALREFAKRMWREAICRPGDEPLRMLLAGPVGTGKSVAARYLAEALEWPCHCVDAPAFDSENAVMTTLAGSSRGIVQSYDDGVLAKISRRPSVVEVADLDHARPGVRGALCEFFLRILQLGTLQTGSGGIVRSLPSVIFIFTTNVAWGAQKANARFGFGSPTREEIRQRVTTSAIDHLGHAFVSRTGDPVIFDEFTRDTAVAVAETEIRSIIIRVTKAVSVSISPSAVRWIIDSVPTLESGARGIIDATRAALAEALKDREEARGSEALVRLVGDRISVEVETRQEGVERPVPIEPPADPEAFTEPM